IPELRPGNTRFDGQFEIPTLEEILVLVRGVEAARTARARQLGTSPPERIGVYPETKHPSHFAARGLAMEAPLLATLARHGYEGREAPVWLQSFEVGNLRALADVTQLKRVQLIEEGGAPYDLIASGDARGYADLIAPAGLEEIAGYAQAIGPNKSLVIPRRADGSLGAPTALIADAHGAGLAVHPWTFRAENAFLPPAGAAEQHQRLARVPARRERGVFQSLPGARRRRLGFRGREARFHRLAEQEPLHADRAAAREEFELRGSLDTLRHHLQTQPMT